MSSKKEKTITEQVIEEEKRAAEKRRNKTADAEEQERRANLMSPTYDVYVRIATDLKISSEAEILANSEVVLDIAECPFVPFQSLRTASVDKLKMSDNHGLLAFTVDIEHNEIMTGGIKDLTKNEHLPHFVFHNVHSMEFGSGEDPRFLYYTEGAKEDNRPWRVMKVDLKTSKKTIIF